MPVPDSMYQSPAGSIPACSQSRSSKALVPDSSPRLTNGDCRARRCAHRLDGRGRAGDAGRVVRGADDDEVVVHHRAPLGAVALVHECLFRRGTVGQHDIGFTPFAQLQRGAGADRDRLQGVAGLLREQRTSASSKPVSAVLVVVARMTSWGRCAPNRRALDAHRSGGN